MDEALQRLLNAEQRAEQIAKQAEEARDQAIQQAHQDAKKAEENFLKTLPEIEDSFMEKALSRAENSIHVIEKRYQEHMEELKKAADVREQDALESALKLLLDPDEV